MTWMIFSDGLNWLNLIGQISGLGISQQQWEILLKYQGGMAEHQDVDNLLSEMESFLRAVARKTPSPNHPIHLRFEHKNNLKVTDRSKKSYSVDESTLSSYRDIYTDKAYKSVRLHNWEFEIDFEGKTCKKIAMIAENVVFIGSKNQKRQISGCHFKIHIADKEEEVRKFSSQTNGYLNRLGKRHLCSYSQNVDKEKLSLVSFIHVDDIKKPSFSYKPWVRPGGNSVDPLSTINNEGKKVLEKLRHFVSRQQIYDFILEQEVSAEGVADLKKFAVGGK